MTTTATDLPRLIDTYAAMRVLRIVRAAADTAITLSGLQTVDGITLADGDLVLVAGQANPTANGVYVAKTGNWYRDGVFGYAIATDGFILEADADSSTYSFWQYTAPPPPRHMALYDDKTFTKVDLLKESNALLAEAQAAAEAAEASAADAAASAAGVIWPVGIIAPFSGTVAPTNWDFADGGALSRTDYAALFAVIGETYGSGDGTTTFNKPDLRGRTAFGKDDMGGTAADRVTSAVSGIDGATLGAAGGDEAMQEHDHTLTDPGHDHPMTGSVGVDVAGEATCLITNSTGNTTGSATTGITMATAGAGDSQNMPPALILNYIIRVK